MGNVLKHKKYVIIILEIGMYSISEAWYFNDII